MKKERLPELHVLSKTIGRTDTSWIKKVENLIEIAGLRMIFFQVRTFFETIAI